MQAALPTQVNIHEAKTRLSQLIEQVEAGGEEQSRPRRVLGALAGQGMCADDANAPLPDELLDAFEGR